MYLSFFIPVHPMTLYVSLYIAQTMALRLNKGTLIQNIMGTNTCHPRGRARRYGTWKRFYVGEDQREWPRTCRIRNCTEPAHGGAHVHATYSREGVFILPMCQKHNTPQNYDWLPVKKGTIVVPVKEGDTSGPQGICYCKKR